MPEENASFRINLQSGEIAFSGSEDFVTSQIEENRDTIDFLLDRLRQTEPESSRMDTDQSAETGGSSAYPNVFDLSDEGVIVIAEVPGTSDKQKTINLTYLYLLGKELLLDESRASFEEIREACKRHACYNSNNFASYVKSAKIVPYGSGRSLSAELTHPGREKAESLAEELNDGDI